MEKIYFEMNDKEKQLTHIKQMLDYALCVITEGIGGTGEYNINVKEVIDLQESIGSNLIKAIDEVDVLLKAAEEDVEVEEVVQEEEPATRVFNAIGGGAEEIQELKDCKVYLVDDMSNSEGGYYGTEIVFHNENTGKYISLLKEDEGEIFLSQWY